MVNETYRVGDIIDGLHDQVRKAPPRKEQVDLNDAVAEVIAIIRGELSKHRVSVQLLLADGMPPAYGDRVQLQQVMLNLILNAIEAMTSLDDDARELVVSTTSSPAQGLLVAVSDSGQVSPRRIVSEFSSPSTPRRAAGWGLDSRFAAPSSMPMRGDCGLTRVSLAAPSFALHCRRRLNQGLRRPPISTDPRPSD